MAFDLDLPRRIYAEFYLNTQWIDLIGDIRQDPGIKIVRSRKNEQAKPTPSECSFWFDDSVEGGNGDYTPRNPLGAYYPYFGRNVPVRIGLKLAEDNFDDRTSSSGWLGDWVNGDSSGGVIANTDWTVSAGTARHTVPNQGQWRGSYYNAAGAVMRNCEQRFTLTRPNASVTGGSYGCSVQFRVQDTDNYIYAWITIDQTETLYVGAIEVVNGVGTILDNGSDVAVFSNPNATTEVRAQMDGNTVRVKAWPSTENEPLDWQVVATGATIDQAGQVGLISYVDTLNTNADPHTFQYDNWELRHPRFTGETSEVTPDMDLSENIRVTKVECGTVFRRMEQGTAPVDSTLKRFISNRFGGFSSLINYWPTEEERFSTQISSGISGKAPMVVGGSDTTIAGGLGSGANTAEFGADDSIAASAPLPHTNLSSWAASLGPHTTTGRYDIRFLLKYPVQNDPSVFLVEFFTNGTASRWHAQLESDGSLSVRAFSGLGGTILDDFGNPVVNNTPALWYLQLVQNGGNIDYTLTYLAVGASAFTSYTSGTVNTQSLGRGLSIGQLSGFDGTLAPDELTFGHLMIGTASIGSSIFVQPLSAFNGETSVERMTRLASENGLLTFGGSYSEGSDTSSAPMGPQQVDTLLNLLIECADTDHGLFADARGANSYLYLPLSYLYGKSPVCTLDHAQEHLAEPFTPTDDDAFTINDVTVKARRGSSARLEQEDGPLNTGDPGTSLGAVGRYDTSKEINPATGDQLRQSANWLLHLGTTDESRFPSIEVKLHDHVMVENTELTLSVLDLDVGDVLAVQNLQNWYIYEEVHQLIFGYTEILDTEYIHTLSFNTGPYRPYNVGNLGTILLDSDNSTLVNAIDDNDLVFDVTTPGATRWVIESDQINTARVLTFAGTTTTAPVSEEFAVEVNIGDKLQLYTTDGVLKEATVFTVTDKTTSGGTTTLTFSPAAAASVALFDIVRTYLASNFPFDIVINGERMTVTDINLGSDPQQFVVTRGNLGFTKAHPAGAEVKLADPYWLGK